MSTDRVTLEVTVRADDQRGSRNVRRLRSQGLVPGVLYGKQSGSHAFVVGERALRAALSGDSGVHTIVDVVFDGTSHSAVVKDFQRHPIRGTLTHIDLHEVRLDQPIQVTVQLLLVGESPGARQGGLVQPVAREVRIEALPTGIPDHVEINIDGLELGGVVRLEDATTAAGVTILDDPQTIVASCYAPRGLDEDEEGDEGAEGAGAEGAGAEVDGGTDDASSEE
jgi:large subunit ribosomal protein L25